MGHVMNQYLLLNIVVVHIWVNDFLILKLQSPDLWKPHYSMIIVRVSACHTNYEANIWTSAVTNHKSFPIVNIGARYHHYETGRG